MRAQHKIALLCEAFLVKRHGRVVVKYAAAERKCRVAVNRAIAQRDCCVVVVNPATAVIGERLPVGISISDRQGGDRDGPSCGDMEHATISVAVHSKLGRSRPPDRDTIVHQQFSACQRDCAIDCEVNSIPIIDYT